MSKTLIVETELTRSTARAAAIIRAGGIVAFPTETVYGLGADVFNAAAVARIFEAKRRPPDNPLIAHIAEMEQVELLAAEIPAGARSLMEAFFPGPLTLVLKKEPTVPKIATAGLDTIGVRMPRNAMAREFLAACGTPVAAPSANLSGRPSPTTWQAVLEDLSGRIDCVLQGEATEIGLESTVVDCTSDLPVILRAGAVSLEQLRAVVPAIDVSREADESTPRSPGLKHRHYAPSAQVVLVETPEGAVSDGDTAYIGLGVPEREFGLILVCRSSEEYAQTVFEFFRECDRRGIGTIYCQAVPEKGIGVALMDRLRRASRDR
jgi:L-threonylcarbamoyladenylate synthase